MAGKVDISEDHGSKTLKSIFCLLQENISAYMKSADLQSEKLLQIRTSRVRRSRTIKASSCPPTNDTYCVKDQSTSMTPPDSSSEETTTECQHFLKVPLMTCSMGTQLDSVDLPEFSQETDLTTKIVYARDYLQTSPCERTDLVGHASQFGDQHLRMARENVDMKVQMQEINFHLRNLEKNKNDDEEFNEKLATIDKIMFKVLTIQKQSEVLCDKLCEGLDHISKQQPISTLPPDLKYFCNRVGNTVGRDARQIGRELGLEDDILDQIDDEFPGDDDCFYHIILEWCKRQETPSYHVLLSACHNVNPDILKSKPLSKDKAKILQHNYDMMCTEMLEIPVLPYLVSSGIMSFKMQRYVLQPDTRDQRISRLISIIYTRENGFDELCEALDKSDQCHVSSKLKCAWSETLEEKVKTTIEGNEIEDNFVPKRRHVLPSTSYQSVDSSEDGHCSLSDSSFSVGSPTLDSTHILQKIYEMINETGIIQAKH